jgi:hypothetical protein
MSLQRFWNQPQRCTPGCGEERPYSIRLALIPKFLTVSHSGSVMCLHFLPPTTPTPLSPRFLGNARAQLSIRSDATLRTRQGCVNAYVTQWSAPLYSYAGGSAASNPAITTDVSLADPFSSDHKTVLKVPSCSQGSNIPCQYVSGINFLPISSYQLAVLSFFRQ